MEQLTMYREVGCQLINRIEYVSGLTMSEVNSDVEDRFFKAVDDNSLAQLKFIINQLSLILDQLTEAA